LWSGVTTEIVDFVVEGHISTGLRCGQRGARGPGISGDVVDGVFRNMSAGSTDETARDIDLPVPVRTLNILFGGRHVSQLRPGLGCRVPAPEVVVVVAKVVTTAINIDKCS